MAIFSVESVPVSNFVDSEIGVHCIWGSKLFSIVMSA